MKATFIVIVGKGDHQHSVYYDDYGNAAECALAYRQMGEDVRIEEMKEMKEIHAGSPIFR